MKEKNFNLKEKKISNKKFYLEIQEWYLDILRKYNISQAKKREKIIRFIIDSLFEEFLKSRNIDRSIINKYNEFEIEPNIFDLNLDYIFKKYTFILEEKTYIQGSKIITPEIIGSIYENLINVYDINISETTRRNTGSYYTPPLIADYMIEQCLIHYFKENTNLSDFLLDHMFKKGRIDFTEKEQKELAKSILDIKVIDPALGCGALVLSVIDKLSDLLNTCYIKNYKKLQAIYLIIKNCIYGVDIQPYPLKIAKFRVLAKLLHEKLSFKEPLDLKINFICANTLLDYKEEKEEQDGFLSLFQPSVKLKKDRLKNFNPYDYESSADFFSPKWMFNIDKFDIVIGNPPFGSIAYISQEIIEQLKETKWSGRDLYDYFIFKGFELTKHKGILSYIVPHTYIGLSSKQKVRDLFLDNRILQIIELPHRCLGGFINTSIFILLKKKSNPNHTYNFGKIDRKHLQYNYITTVKYKSIEKMPNRSFIIRKQSPLFDRLLEYSTLDDVCEMKAVGIHTGNCRHKLFFKDNDGTREKLLQGRQIHRYLINWDSPKAQYKYCNINYQPQPIKGISKGKESRKNEYWTLKTAEYHHREERLLVRQTSDRLITAYHSLSRWGQFYTDETLYSVFLKDGIQTIKLAFLCGLFNSKLLNYIYDLFVQEDKKEMAQVKIAITMRLPFIQPNKEQHDKVVELVNKAIDAKYQNSNVNIDYYQDKIDELVYNIYNVTEEEKAYIK